MKLTFRVTALIVLLLAAATIASADGVTRLTLNNGGSDIMGGVFVGPYNFTSNGQSLQLICDDFYNNVYSGESWTATTTTLSNLSGVMFAGSTTQYQEAAYLVGLLYANIGDPQKVGEIQWAIWAIFDTQLLTQAGPKYGLTDTQVGYMDSYYADALACGSPGTCSYPNVTLYTPQLGSQVPYGDGQPQEYIGVPEPGTLVLLVAGLLALMLLVIRRSHA